MSQARWVRVFRSRNGDVRENTYVLDLSTRVPGVIDRTGGHLVRTTTERVRGRNEDGVLWETTSQALVHVPGVSPVNVYPGWAQLTASGANPSEAEA